VIRRLEPATIAAGSPDTELTIRGDRLGTVSKVKLGDEEREPEKRTDNRVTVTLTVEDLETPREIKVAVIGQSGESAPKVLKVTEVPLIVELSADKSTKILTITGKRLATVSQVRIGDRKATPENADETTVTVKLNDDELTEGRTIQVVVIGESGESPPKDFSTTP
jgi:hypothetical protein